jgi:hypothetical protein
LGFAVTHCPTHPFLDFAADVPGRSGYAIFVHYALHMEPV